MLSFLCHGATAGLTDENSHAIVREVLAQGFEFSRGDMETALLSVKFAEAALGLLCVIQRGIAESRERGHAHQIAMA